MSPRNEVVERVVFRGSGPFGHALILVVPRQDLLVHLLVLGLEAGILLAKLSDQPDGFAGLSFEFGDAGGPLVRGGFGAGAGVFP